MALCYVMRQARHDRLSGLRAAGLFIFGGSPPGLGGRTARADAEAHGAPLGALPRGALRVRGVAKELLSNRSEAPHGATGGA